MARLDVVNLRSADDRVLVRRWRSTEADRLFDILSRPEVTRWLGESSAEPLTAVAQARTKIERWDADLLLPPQGCWAIVSTAVDVPVGTVLIMEAPNATVGELEVGWYLHPDSVGQGYATAAARLALRHAFGHGATEVFAQTTVDNAASQSVCHRLGMTDLGEVDGLWCAGPSRLFVTSTP